jgi:hypothetical protein
MPEVPHPLASFAGQWMFTRYIEKQAASVQGIAEFSWLDTDRLAYVERGELTLADGRSLRCERRYQFVASAADVRVEFDDGLNRGGHFVTLHFQADGDHDWLASDTHYCGQDIYVVEYRLNMPTSYDTKIIVIGPNKDYCATTRYTKI